MKAVILGSGSSSGTPGVGIGWGKCDPTNPLNRRLRPSILVEAAPTRLLVDTSPDLRQQLLNAEVDRVDGVLYTHGHADHLHGIDDLRGINRTLNQPLAIYADPRTLEGIRRRFGYAFEPLRPDVKIYYKPTLIPHEILAGTPFRIGGIEVQPFDQDHGYSRTLGFRFGPIAYSTDLVDMTEEGFQTLVGVEVWILGVFREEPHETHVHVDKALSWVERVKAKRTVLTHLSPWLDYDSLKARLPKGVEPAYDGMVIEA
jgi:phosphoribosyl 1,2-cyclic phosphate phosphodiesterase